MDAYSRFDERERQHERDEILDEIEVRGDWYADLFAGMRAGQVARDPDYILNAVQKFVQWGNAA